MAEKTLEQRVAVIEAQLAGNSLQEYFREQAELIDRLFTYRFEEYDKKWDARLDAKLARLEAKVDLKLEPIRSDVSAAKNDLRLARSDLAVIKDAVRIILKRLK